MAKYEPMDLLKSLSGKVCQHSDMAFANRKGTKYTMKRCQERSTPYSEEELARQTRFASVRAKVLILTEEEIAAYAAAFKKSPGKYTTLQGYIFAQEYKKLNGQS